MTERYESVFINLISTVTIPLIQVFALYIVTHGHYSPGGGFQGGVMLAASTILLRIARGSEASFRLFPLSWGIGMAAGGVLVFALTGVAGMLGGGPFLDYGSIPVPGMDVPTRRYWGILIAEVGIGLAVWGALVAIFDALTGGGYEALPDEETEATEGTETAAPAGGGAR